MKYDVFLCVLLINNCGVHSRLPMCVVNKQLWRAQQAFNAVLQVSSNGCTCMQVCACSGVVSNVQGNVSAKIGRLGDTPGHAQLKLRWLG